MKQTLLLLLACLLTCASFSQDTLMRELPAGYLADVASRIGDLEQKLDNTSRKALARFQREEEKIEQKLSQLDSVKAKAVFGSAKGTYARLQQKLQGKGELTQYIPYFDTLKTSLLFLSEHKELLSPVKDLEKQYGDALAKVNDLEKSLAKAKDIKDFIRERKAYLREQLQGLPFARKLKRLNKQAYYYSARVAEYKEAFKDPRKRERKAIELLSKTKPFQDFMRKNSGLASLFRLPGSDSDPTGGASLAGLQTRASVNSLLQARLGSGASAQAVFQQNVQAGQAQLSALKDKAAQYGTGSFGSSEEVEMPDFTPNGQKTKSLLKRLEWGANLQTQKGTRYFPVTSDIGLSLGYKLNDKSIIGIGASYKLGLGRGWEHIALSHQGLGLRSFVDYRLKGGLFISGGYEQNYRQGFTTISQLKDYSGWQSSGLIGLSKKYRAGKKLKGNMQLLWDFLSYEQVPRTQAVVFRVGYNIK